MQVRTDEPDRRFAVGGTLYTENNEELVIEVVRWHGQRLVVTFVGIHDREAADQLRGKLLQFDRPPNDVPEDPRE